MATSTAAANATGEVSRLLSVSATNLREQWRFTWFGITANTGSAADLYDPDTAGFANLLEFTQGTSPLLPSTNPGLQVSGVSPGLSFLTFFFLRSRPLPEITFEVHTTSASAKWSVIATNPGSFGVEIPVSDSVPLTAAS